jgi:hypothetical protein
MLVAVPCFHSASPIGTARRAVKFIFGKELVVGTPVPGLRMARRPCPDQNGQGDTGRGSLAVDWERLSRIYIHPLRISILEVLAIDEGRVLSPTDPNRELQHDLSSVNYHVRQLAKAGLIVLAYRRPVCGTNENFHCLFQGWRSESPAGARRPRRHPARLALMDLWAKAS